LGIAQLLLPGGHRCGDDALADPVEELARGVLRYVDLQVEGTRDERERGRAVPQALRPVADGTVRLIERAARGNARGRVRRRVLREARGERDGRRWDVRGDGVPEAERYDDEQPQEGRALCEPAPVTTPTPPDQREDTEEDRADREHDRDLLETLPRDRKGHFSISGLTA